MMRRTDIPHWVAPDMLGDILAIAREAGAASPVEIHMRLQVHDRLAKRAPDATGAAPGTLSDLGGIPVVVDEGIPAFPGYEIHRAALGPTPHQEHRAPGDEPPQGTDGPSQGTDVSHAA